MKNYYNILGVSETASQDEIKKAYRKLSKQYHPDVNPEGEEMFKDVSEAYDNLGDENKRRQYDNSKNNPFAGMGGPGMDINSIFEQMMGGQRQKQRAPDKVITVNLTPKDSFFGVKKDFEYSVADCCDTCNGNGGDRSICHHCKGNGFIVQQFGTGMFRQTIQSACPHCNGQGSTIMKVCTSCNAKGVKIIKEKINVTIPKNVDNGDFLRIQGKGDYNLNAKIKGDIILKVNLINDNGFEKMGRDLIYAVKISPLSVIMNEQIEIPHPEGTIKVSLPNEFDSDRPLRVGGKGYKYPDGNGSLYVKVGVKSNLKYSDEVLNSVKELLEQTNNITD
jgi:molecular chaperone DnaJ